jgi:hypothetical protein
VVGVDFCKSVIDFMEAWKESKGLDAIKFEQMDCRGKLLNVAED